ncbi:4-alpha-glucanotransferase [Oxynema sp. CENA135]|uniref:4-alpha-glucanotransferase n=1 Tax=Oxynema sp. CENA135 TaxID=984206 RepID=UPI00351CADEE
MVVVSFQFTPRVILMPFPRSSGILLHPTSFPSRFGIGDLGDEAHRFIDFLVESGQQFWQILPIGPTGYGNSPYMSYSAMAGNPLLVSPDRLVEAGWLEEADFANLPEFPTDRVDYDRAIAVKMPLLQKAFERYRDNATDEQREVFNHFCDEKAYWLDDYSLFMSIKEAHAGVSWHNWDLGISRRDPGAMHIWHEQVGESVYFHKFLQFEFFRQWSEIKDYANERGIAIVGDLPIYVAHDSADVWANPDIFCLDPESGEAALMAGVPPDYFSDTGQLWGNPVYNWDRLKETDFEWWVKRFHAMLDYVDVIRIDHFRGLESYWVVEEGETTAINGRWVEAPGEHFLQRVADKLGQLPLIAEDLGIITPEVEHLRDHFALPGMKILHFAFGSGAGNPYLPFNFYNRNCIVYTGTHDNDTTVGWFEKLADHERQGLLAYLGEVSSWGIHWDLIRVAWSSVANQAIVPLQDLFGLGSEARMNFPSKPEGNWEWRYQSGDLKSEYARRLKMLTETFGRAKS